MIVGTVYLNNKKGMTLVEVMVALVVFLIVALAVMQTAMVVMESNMKNSLRDEAVAVAEARLDEARNTPFDTLTALGLPDRGEPRTVRSRQDFNFDTRMRICDTSANCPPLPTADMLVVTAYVDWQWKDEASKSEFGISFKHRVSTIIRREE